MKKYLNKRRLVKIATVITLTIIAISVFQYRGAINCFAINWSSFNDIERNVYVDPDISSEEYNVILDNISLAKERVAKLYGSFNATPVIIVCKDIEAGRKYGMKNKTGITLKTITGTYIVLGQDGVNVDVIAHELTHSELAYRIGGIRSLRVPVWFDDGLATQVDNRPQYSESEWQRRTENGTKLIKMSELDSAKQFYVSDLDTRIFHYTLVKHELDRWLSIVNQKGLLQLIEDVKKGEEFYSVYNRLELEIKKD